MEKKEDKQKLENTEIAIVLEQNPIGESRGQKILKQFETFFTQAAEWEKKVKDIVITDSSQTELMAQCREGRLILKKIRVEADHKRKELKEDSLREGRVIQGIYNVIENTIKPLEEHLLEQEQFVVRQEQKRIAELTEERKTLLEPYKEFVPVGVGVLGAMEKEDFEKLLNGAKLQHEDKIRREEEERIAREKAEKIQLLNRKRFAELAPLSDFIEDFSTVNFGELTDEKYQEIKLDAEQKKEDHRRAEIERQKEIEKLKKEREDQEKKEEERKEKERKRTEERLEEIKGLGMELVGTGQYGIPGIWSGLYMEIITNRTPEEWGKYIAQVKEAKLEHKARLEEEKRLEKERKQLEAEEKKRQEEAEKELAAERKAKEEAEAKLRAQQEAEKKRKEQEEADRQKRLGAPDKEKLQNFAVQLGQPELELKSEKGQAIYKIVKSKLDDLCEFIVLESEKL